MIVQGGLVQLVETIVMIQCVILQATYPAGYFQAEISLLPVKLWLCPVKAMEVSVRWPFLSFGNDLGMNLL